MTDIRVHQDEYRRRAEAFAASIGADPGSPAEWKDPVRLSALGLGVLRGVPIRLEIEERRERIRRAAGLAKILEHAAGGELIEVTHPRPKTVAGIAVLRARRIQLREVSALTESAAWTLDRVERAAAAYTLPRVYDLPGSAR